MICLAAAAFWRVTGEETAAEMSGAGGRPSLNLNVSTLEPATSPSIGVQDLLPNPSQPQPGTQIIEKRANPMSGRDGVLANWGEREIWRWYKAEWGRRARLR